MLEINLTKSAIKELDSLNSEMAKRIAKAIDELSLMGRASSNLKSLSPPLIGYRKRVGEYRILFDIYDDTIIIYRISKRCL
jgi:mRNA interferase RelE/StbE